MNCLGVAGPVARVARVVRVVRVAEVAGVAGVARVAEAGAVSVAVAGAPARLYPLEPPSTVQTRS